MKLFYKTSKNLVSNSKLEEMSHFLSEEGNLAHSFILFKYVMWLMRNNQQTN